jgi:hypothetical protein
MQMRTPSIRFLFAIAALAIAGFGLGQSGRIPSAPGSAKITVLNPAVASRMVERLSLSPRLNTLEGKTIYMVDINWGGSETAYSVFEEMQAWFGRNMPAVKSVIKIKRGGYDADDPALWKEIAQNGNAAIIGVSG